MACSSPITKVGILSWNRAPFVKPLTLTQYDPFLVYHFIKNTLSQCLTDPTIGNLFNLKMYHQLDRISSLLLMCNDFEENILPANLVLGGVEVFVGVLVAILPFPYAREAGIALILDGAYRAFDGVGEMDQQNRAYIFGTNTDSE